MIPDWRIFINIATTPIKHGGGCFPGRAYIPPPYPPLFMDGSCPQRSSSAQWVNETPPCLFMTRRDEAQVCDRWRTSFSALALQSGAMHSLPCIDCRVTELAQRLLFFCFFFFCKRTAAQVDCRTRSTYTRKPEALRGFEEWRLLQSHVGAFNLPCNFYVM